MMQCVSELPSVVEKIAAAQFNTITEQMLREQRLRSSSPARKGGPLGSSPRPQHITLSNKNTTSFSASMRSLPDSRSNKPPGRGDIQEEPKLDEIYGNASLINGRESMIKGSPAVGKNTYSLLDISQNDTCLDKTQAKSDTSGFNQICTTDTAISSETSLAFLSEMSDSKSIRMISQDPITVALQAVTQDTLITPTNDSKRNDGRLDNVVVECEDNSKQDMKVTGHDDTMDNTKPPNCVDESQNDDRTVCDRRSCFNETILAAGSESGGNITSEAGPADDNNDWQREGYCSLPAAGSEAKESVEAGSGSMTDHDDGQRQDCHPNRQANVWLVCRCGHIANSRLEFRSCPVCNAVDTLNDPQLPGKIGHWIGASNLLDPFKVLWGDDKIS